MMIYSIEQDAKSNTYFSEKINTIHSEEKSKHSVLQYFLIPSKNALKTPC